MKKANTIELFCTADNHKEEFEVNHAERILRMPDNGGWVLPEDSQYKFDNDNGITIKRGSNDTQRTEEQK